MLERKKKETMAGDGIGSVGKKEAIDGGGIGYVGKN